LRDYELVLVISPEVAEEELPTSVERINQLIAHRGGSITHTDYWGKRRLAYPIKRFLEGSYVLAQLKLEPESTEELEAHLQISEEVLRHLLVRLSDEG
jgi:small subunit ribosomal protein S6